MLPLPIIITIYQQSVILKIPFTSMHVTFEHTFIQSWKPSLLSIITPNLVSKYFNCSLQFSASPLLCGGNLPFI